MPCKNKGRAVSSSLKIKCKDCNFFGVHVLGVLTLTLAGRGSGTIPPGLRAWGGHKHGEEMGCIFLFVKKPEFKKKKISIPSMALPTHQKKCTIMSIIESREKFLSVWSHLTLSASESNGCSFRLLIHVSFSMFKLNYLFLKSLFSAVFPPTHSRRE